MTIEDAVFLASGSNATAWKLATNSGVYVLRRVTNERELCWAIDRRTREFVLGRGGRVAEPVIAFGTAESDGSVSRWSLDEWVSGIHPKRGEIPPRASRQLGETLAVLHELPVQGYGRSGRFVGGRVAGQAAQPLQGVAQRFENVMPEIWPAGFRHPMQSALPAEWPEILARLSEVSRQVGLGWRVMCHSDLHERQLICDDNDLAALIDFGDASILDPHWDLGSALYFHEVSSIIPLINSYRANAASLVCYPELVKCFAIAIAMHHASRSRLRGKEHRLQFAKQRIQALLKPGF